MKILVTGAGGMLARAIVAEAAVRGHAVTALARTDLDVTDAAAVLRTMDDARPDAVIQCAAFTRVDDAETAEDVARLVNADGAREVARAAAAAGARMLYPSTDYVFDGAAAKPYAPDDPTAPLNAYGRTKLAGENAVLAEGGSVVRTSWLYGAGGPNFVTAILRRARAGEPLRVVDDQHGSPTWTGSLAVVLLTLLEKDAPNGVYHATNSGETTWFGFAAEALRLAGIEADMTRATTAEFQRRARRPAYSVLDCGATEAIVGPIPDWRAALATALSLGGLEA